MQDNESVLEIPDLSTYDTLNKSITVWDFFTQIGH